MSYPAVAPVPLQRASTRAISYTNGRADPSLGPMGKVMCDVLTRITRNLIRSYDELDGLRTRDGISSFGKAILGDLCTNPWAEPLEPSCWAFPIVFTVG